MDGYALFFIGAGLLGIPALVLCVDFLTRGECAVQSTANSKVQQRRTL